MTTLATSLTADAVGDTIFAYGPRIDFSAAASGAEREALEFTSPQDYYLCQVNVSLDSGSWSADDIMAIILKANLNTLYQSKWKINATTLGSPQMIDPISIVLAPETQFKLLLAFSSGTAMTGSGSAILTGTRRL
jgi:hypothetical protein